MVSQSIYLLFKSPPGTRQARAVYVIIGAIMAALVSICFISNVVFADFMWIDHRDFPGGPYAYLIANSSVWWQTLGTACTMVTNFIGDGLLVCLIFQVIYDPVPDDFFTFHFRYIAFGSYGEPSGRSLWFLLLCIWAPSVSDRFRNHQDYSYGLYYIPAVSLTFFDTTTAMAFISVVQGALPGSNFFRGKSVNFGVPWAALSVFLNVIVTALICTRLILIRRQAAGHLPAEFLQMYTGVMALLVESALPFSIFGIVFAVTYGRNLNVAPVFLFIWGDLCVCSRYYDRYSQTTDSMRCTSNPL